MPNFLSSSFGFVKWGFLRHVVSGDEIFVDPKKMEVIVSWELPSNVSEVWSFLVLVGYY